MNLHYGCGLNAADGWFNCDASPTLRLQRWPLVGSLFRRFLSPEFPSAVEYGNIVTGLGLKPDSCDAIYCCHVLEHLSLEDCRAALRNTFFYLKSDGLFRCVLPDLEQQIETYRSDTTPSAATEFLSYTFLGRKTRPRRILEHVREMFGNSHHLWMWDYKALTAELRDVGFCNIRRCQFGDSKEKAFAAVENRGRFDWALAVECAK